MASRTRGLLASAFLAFALIPSLGASEPRDCAAAANSVLREPDWYLAECLGGVKPSVPPVRHTGPRSIGDTEYILNLRGGTPVGQSVLTAPLATLDYVVVGPQTRQIFAMDFDLTATTLWAIDNTTREYGTIDQATGAFALVGTVTGLPAGNTTGLKFDPTSSIVYLSATDGVSSSLFTLDLGTGAATLVGSIGAFTVIEIAISNTGQMYGTEIVTDNLLSIDKTTGTGTLIGPLGVAISFAQGMDFDASTNILYAWLYTGGGVNQLASINLATGAATTLDNGVNEENEGSIKVPASVPNVAPVALAVDPLFNGVFEANETAAVQPSWKNQDILPIDLTGAVSAFDGPAGPTYSILDGAGDYGTIDPSATEECTDCYFLNITTVLRPQLHWDATFLETVTPTDTAKLWTLHVGGSFEDVPMDAFYPSIETILHNEITAGGSCGGFCPEDSTLRKQMAVFVLKAVEGASYTPPPAIGIFNDVPSDDPFAPWIEELFNRGVVAGCAAPNGPNYCPEDPVLRQQMAVFLIRTLEGSAYTPPACTGIFDDVECPSQFADWVEDLALSGITAGCAPDLYCPVDPVKRKQMAVFLSLTFGLQLYAP
jgi:hypothetical protein